MAALNFADQMKSLTILIAVWQACDILLTCLYNRIFPRPGFMGFVFLVALLFAAYRLSDNTQGVWLWYATSIVFGWVIVVLSTIENARQSNWT